MRVVDASSIIHAWDAYPVEQFPGLWQWLAVQVASLELRLPVVAFDEVAHKSPDCAHWLRDNEHAAIGIDNAVLQHASRIKSLIGVVNDRFHAKGVGENDLLIIAVAYVHGSELVSDESRQPIAPDAPSKRKIPAVCAMPEVDVTCMNFLEFIRRSGAVFR